MTSQATAAVCGNCWLRSIVQHIQSPTLSCLVVAQIVGGPVVSDDAQIRPLATPSPPLSPSAPFRRDLLDLVLATSPEEVGRNSAVPRITHPDGLIYPPGHVEHLFPFWIIPNMRSEVKSVRGRGLAADHKESSPQRGLPERVRVGEEPECRYRATRPLRPEPGGMGVRQDPKTGDSATSRSGKWPHRQWVEHPCSTNEARGPEPAPTEIGWGLNTRRFSCSRARSV